MRKKKRRKIAEQELLDTIFALEREWKQIQQIVEKSIEPSENSLNHLRLAQAKYMFLLREARHKNLSAMS